MEKITIESEIFYRIREISLVRPENTQKKLVEFLEMIKPKKLRTSLQNRASHKDWLMIAEKLNDAGLDMRKVLKQEISIPWTTESVKEFIVKPIMEVMYNKKSTTQLEKNTDEIEKLHNVIMRELGEKFGIEYHDFPHNPDKKKEMIEMMKPMQEVKDYPDDYAPADKF